MCHFSILLHGIAIASFVAADFGAPGWGSPGFWLSAVLVPLFIFYFSF